MPDPVELESEISGWQNKPYSGPGLGDYDPRSEVSYEKQKN